MLSKLTDIGLRKVGLWSLECDEPILAIVEEADSANILYSFVVDGISKYIGTTTQSLKKRMYGYGKPSATVLVNLNNG